MSRPSDLSALAGVRFDFLCERGAAGARGIEGRATGPDRDGRRMKGSFSPDYG